MRNLDYKDLEMNLGVDLIRNWVASECRTNVGKNHVIKAVFSSDYAVVRTRLNQTSEMIRLMIAGDIPNQDFFDLGELLKRIKIPGTFLEGDDYLIVAKATRGLVEWLKFLNDKKSPALAKLFEGLAVDISVASEIDRSLDNEGVVRDTATPALSAIRKQMLKAEKSARVAISRILSKSISDQFSPDDSQVTFRDGRLVIPVKAEFKNSIPGLVHDESASGQTVFLEPAEALAINNEVRELKNQERREVIRILIKLADLIREKLPNLLQGARLLGLLDFIHAKAVWARKFHAITPTVEKTPSVSIRKGIHPVLWKSHQESVKPVIPLNLTLDERQRILVISGPNAGGKSVTLKTVGLLQYLIQCGFPVPVDEDSTFGIFHDLFLDIGDTQSLENDLSTYSAHLTAMKKFLKEAGAKSLILIDEFGKGTEPQFGGAIAESILNSLNDQRCFGVVTTHYQNLKNLADTKPNMINGAMKFDINKLEPVYLLETGKPGSSFAFEIATKIGLPDQVIKEAKSLMNSGQVDFDQSLNKLEKEKQKFQKLASQLDHDQKQTAQVRQDYEELREMMVLEKKRIIREAREEAQKLLKDANRQIERTIREIKESGAEKKKTQLARENLIKIEDKIKEKSVKKRPLSSKLKIGDFVKMDNQTGSGEIIRIKGKNAEIKFGSMKSFVGLDRLHKVNVVKKEVQIQSTSGYSRIQSALAFNHELILLGLRAEEALPKLDSFVDQAIMNGINEARIVHGKGYGILRDLVRNHLTGHPNILSISDDHVDQGGAGISILRFK